MYHAVARPPRDQELAMRQTELRLTDEDRELIESYRAKGLHHAREVNRAHILSALDRGVPESQIMAVLDVGRTVIWRTRAAYLEGGVEYSLRDAARPGKPRRDGTGVEAQISALAFPRAPAQPAGSTGAAGLRLQARRHVQSLRGGGTQGRTADGLGHRPPRQARLRGLRPISARTGLCHGAPSSSGHGQPQYPLPQVLRGSARRQRGAGTSAPRCLSLHSETRQLAQYV